MLMQYHQQQQLQKQEYPTLETFVKLSFEFSHSPGVAKATGTVITKPNETKTNIVVKAVIINLFKKFLY
jgi:hypothetical protein